MGYREFYHLDWTWLTKEDTDVKNEETKKNLGLTCGVIHPALTFTGIQPYVIVGSNNGTIMKFSCN